MLNLPYTLTSETEVPQLTLTNPMTLQTAADVIQFSGCRDEEVSVEGKIRAKQSGVLTFAFLKVLRKNISNQPNYSHLLYACV